MRDAVPSSSPVSASTGARIILVREQQDAGHFAGVAQAARAAGGECHELHEHNAGDIRALLDSCAGRAAIVAVKDTQSPVSLYAMRQARERGVPTALLMDGIVECRNTLCNPWAEPGFLRPAPVDLVLCAGARDEERLVSLGNRAVATGLPRLTSLAAAPSAAPAGRSILVATARRPAMSDAEWATVARALERLRDELSGFEVVWRLTGGLDAHLGVTNDDRPLGAALADCAAVLTTPSTLMLEAMMAGRSVGLIHPWATDLWQEAVWVWDGASGARGIVAEMLSATRDQRTHQEEILGRSHGARDGAAPAVAVARALRALSVEPGIARACTSRAALPAIARLPEPVPGRPGAARVVNMVAIDGSPVGGVMTWALRLARACKEQSLGFDVRTLVIANGSAALSEPGFDVNPDGLTDVCILDPMMDEHERVLHLRRAVEVLEPDIVLPNYNDLCFMASAQVKTASKDRVRIIAIAHTDSAYYRDLARQYDCWDAAVGVSGACCEWLRELAGARPVRQIVYGVPGSECARRPSPGGPLRLCYIGRMVEEQKRVGLLVPLSKGLEERGVEFELHLVGDGAELGRLRREFAALGLERGRVLFHGRRPVAWVERFLADMDVSVLVSSYEGTSISMLEAMAQGVVPCITRVDSGVDEWVHDGVEGIVVPVDETGAMPERLEALWRDRDLLSSLGMRAWARARAATVGRVSREYAEVFRQTVESPARANWARDCAAAPMAVWRWEKPWCDDPAGADRYAQRVLAEAGCREILSDPSAADVPGAADPGSDRRGVVFTSTAARSIDVEEIDRWRDAGLLVAVSPVVPLAVMLRGARALRDAAEAGHRRIAIYGVGRHTHKMRAVIERSRSAVRSRAGGSQAAVVGFIDDNAGPGATCFGLPVVCVESVLDTLDPDCVILSSDAFEQKMWDRCEPLRDAGVRVISLYGAGESTRSGGDAAASSRVDPASRDMVRPTRSTILSAAGR